jgi:hypothetical protein
MYWCLLTCESIQRIRKVLGEAVQELKRIARASDTETLVSILEEAYLKPSAGVDWKPVNYTDRNSYRCDGNEGVEKLVENVFKLTQCILP